MSDTSTQFPIFDTRRGWMSNSRRKTGRFPPAFLEFVERVQPYHAANPTRSPLNILRILDDRDKHKLLTVTVAVPGGLYVRGITSSGDVPAQVRCNILPDPTLEDGALLATFVVSGLEPEKSVDAKLAPIVTFGEEFPAGPRVEVLGTLRAIIADVETVVRESGRILGVAGARGT